nr:Ycf1 [Ligusticopsis sp. RT-2022a]WGS94095.1 Ycf1 [Ligusticopsis sp. RT-2022a]WGS94181.1 Ycf1 [Ligusticopsis sp. RT-2022a]WGS94193.1 Ycf1 [Ligusticopsis sp. RT-2022a]WGS94266.1 Ycf1 [Ligusticopsis sp. RT-2022a]
MQQQDVICNKQFCWLVNWSHFIHEMGWIGISLDTANNSDHILHRALLSLPSPSSGYGRRIFY